MVVGDLITQHSFVDFGLGLGEGSWADVFSILVFDFDVPA